MIRELLIVTGTQPAELVAFAAQELQRYVSKLFGLQATIAAKTGPADATILLDAEASGMQAPSDDQSFALRRFERGGHPFLLAVGDSPAATLWASYELVEQWGVRYLLHGDVFPDERGDF